jgi:hypothetical protein
VTDIAYVTDHLLYRDECLTNDELMFEYFLAQKLTVKSYTLAYQEKKILGPLEQNSIRSTFLSGLFAGKKILWRELSFWKAMMIGRAQDDCVVSCKTPIVFCHAKPWALGNPRCQNQQWMIILDDVATLVSAASSWKTRFLVEKTLKAIKASDVIFLASHIEKDQFGELYRLLLKKELPCSLQILPPPLPLHEFPFSEEPPEVTGELPWKVQWKGELTALQRPYRVVTLAPAGKKLTKEELQFVSDIIKGKAENEQLVIVPHCKNEDLPQGLLSDDRLTFLVDSCDGVLGGVFTHATAIHTYYGAPLFPRHYFLGLSVGTKTTIETPHESTSVHQKNKDLETRSQRRQESMRFHSLRWKSTLIQRYEMFRKNIVREREVVQQ